MTAHDCDVAGCDGLVRRAHRERLTQGLPLVVADAGALARVAEAFNAPATADDEREAG